MPPKAQMVVRGVLAVNVVQYCGLMVENHPIMVLDFVFLNHFALSFRKCPGKITAREYRAPDVLFLFLI